MSKGTTNPPETRSRLKKGDQVVVIAGKDKGKQGKILRMYLKDNRALVENVNIVRRHTKPSRDDQGGIKEKEASIHLSNLMIVDPATGKGARIGKKVQDNGQKIRIARGSAEPLDS